MDICQALRAAPSRAARRDLRMFDGSAARVRPRTSRSEEGRSERKLIFIVEDDTDIARLEKHHLEMAGYAVSTFSSAATVVAAAEKDPPALFLFDIMLPGASGLDLLRQIRRSARLAHIPIIFVTAKTEEPDRVTGLEIGADDYIVKPFSPKDMVARVSAVLRRAHRRPVRETLRFGHIDIDFDAMTVARSGSTIGMTTTEFRLLEYLVRHSRVVHTRDQLLDAIWRDTANVGPRTVDVYIRRLREKIEADPENPRYLRTVRGVGYRFDDPGSDRP